MQRTSWRSATRSYEETRLRESPALFAHYQWTFVSGDSEAEVEVAGKRLMEQALSRRAELERAYNDLE